MGAATAGLEMMGSAPWIFGVVGLFAVSSAPAFVRAHHVPRELPASLWDIPRVAQIYTTVVGTLAGFAAASTVFVARLGVDHPGPAFETTIALFLLAFLMLAGAAMEFGNTPNSPTQTSPEFLHTQRLAFLLANVTLTQGVTTGWLALRALVSLVGLPALSNQLAWLLMLIVVVAGFRIAQYLYDHTSVSGLVTVLTPIVTMAAAGVYMFGVAPAVPALGPSEHAPVHFAMIGALVALTGFGLQAILFALQTNGVFRGRIARYMELAVVAHAQITVASIGLVAITVVFPNA